MIRILTLDQAKRHFKLTEAESFQLFTSFIMEHPLEQYAGDNDEIIFIDRCIFAAWLDENKEELEFIRSQD